MAMDWKVSRWARIMRLNPDQLNKLHRTERRFARINADNPKYKRFGPFRIGEMAGEAFLRAVEDEIGPFWPARTPDDHRDAEMRRFEKAIYQIWAPLEKEYVDCKITQGSFMHEADNLIYESGFSFRKYSDVSGGVASKWGKNKPNTKKLERGCPDD